MIDANGLIVVKDHVILDGSVVLLFLSSAVDGRQGGVHIYPLLCTEIGADYRELIFLILVKQILHDVLLDFRYIIDSINTGVHYIFNELLVSLEVV